ncbi:MAG: DUF1015 family protein [Acidaminococcaceae bacterium]
MATIKPFKGLRPLPELVAQIASLPYDVMDTEEARAILAQKPLSFLSVTKAEATLPVGTEVHSAEVYAQAKANLEGYLTAGQMRQEPQVAYYIYRQQMGEHIQIGLVATASVQEYRENIIKKHELTRCDKELDRVNHILATEAQTGPVFLTYKNRGEINALMLQLMSEKKPSYDFTGEDKIRHTLYVVKEPLEVTAVTKAFANIPNLYIADGHHRAAAAMRVAEQWGKRPEQTGQEAYNYFLAVIFPDNMMKILDYNRAVKDLGGLTTTEFMTGLHKVFTVENSGHNPKPTKLHQFGMYLDGQWYTLQAKVTSYEGTDLVACLDVSILQKTVLAPLLGIMDPRTDEKIAFIGGIRGLQELEKRVDDGEFRVAFALYPTSISQLMKIADMGQLMPPKSTWFEPKLRDAMVVHLIGDEQ